MKRNQDSFSRFCKTHRLRSVTNQEDGTAVVKGRLGEIYEYSDREVAAMFFPPKLLKGWTHRRDALTEFDTATVVQNGDFEGVVTIEMADPRIRQWVALAQKLLGIKRRRELSVEKKEILCTRLAKVREMKALV